jgi:hypothetical protein
VVYAFAERKGLSREDAQDVAQLVFARVLNTEKLEGLAPANRLDVAGRFSFSVKSSAASLHRV